MKKSLICNMYIGSFNTDEARATLILCAKAGWTVGELHKALRHQLFEQKGLLKDGKFDSKKINDLWNDSYSDLDSYLEKKKQGVLNGEEINYNTTTETTARKAKKGTTKKLRSKQVDKEK